MRHHRWPLVQWQDTGLWIREWWFESTGTNPHQEKKRAGWPDPRPRWVLPASTLRLGLVGLRLLRLLDLAIGRALGLLRLGLGQAEAVECLADALAALQAGEDGRGRDGGVLGAEVLGEHVRGDELTARELRVRRVGRLELVLEILGRNAQLGRDAAEALLRPGLGLGPARRVALGPCGWMRRRRVGRRSLRVSRSLRRRGRVRRDEEQRNQRCTRERNQPCELHASSFEMFRILLT